MKDSYTGKFIKLDFSQNLSLIPKYEVQSAHFSGKQYTFHCAIVEPFDTRYHYHLSDDTKHDPFYVDQVLRDIIIKYDIKDEDLWIQNDNAPTQYKNKHAFALLQKLVDDFNLRIIRTYGAAGHGKGVIDVMYSFSAKNILRKDIVTHDVFFNNSAEIVDYLSSINPHYYYTTVPVEDVVKTRHRDHSPFEITGCMKQHLILFNPKKEQFCTEYLCDCASCLQFHFNDCINKAVSSEKNPQADADAEEIDIFDEEADQSE